MSFEVELKVKISEEEKSKIQNYIQENNPVYLGEIEHIDLYFDKKDSNLSLAIEDKALRLRTARKTNDPSSSRLDVTFKGPKIKSTSKTRQEFELYLVPNSSYKDVLAFFEALDYQQKISVRKKRKDYQLQGGVKLSLDEVEVLGNFIELEVVSHTFEEITEAEDKLWILIRNILGDISIDRSIMESYVEMLLVNLGEITS
ncbi:MAG: class IV adenylate cyclase [Candidatus Hodarchaeales archaeon]|jgi:predicted adenylyl cyclase CyaB